MSEIPTCTPAPPRSVARLIGRVIFWLFVGLVFLFFLLPSLGSLGPGSFELPPVLLTGWIKFLVRTTPNVTWNWDLVGMGVVSAGLVLVLTHWFLRWLVNSVALARGASWRWPWKWTWSAFVAIALLFLVGMATGGVVHQIGWIAASPEPWTERKYGREDTGNMMQLQGALEQALNESDGDLEKARRELWKPGVYFRDPGGSYRAEYHLLAVTSEAGKVTGTLIFPRNGERRSAAGGCYSTIGGDLGKAAGRKFIPAAKLLELIQTNRAHLKAL